MQVNSYRDISRCVRSALLILLLFFVASCSRKIRFVTSTVVPAAEGRVKVKKDKNDNYAIDVEIKNLAEPNRLPVPQNVYVVWIDTREGLKNLGRLKTGSGLLSSTLKADMETVTPFRPNRLFITAEGDASVSYPNSQVVLTTNSF